MMFHRPSRIAFWAILSCRLLVQILGRIGSSGVLTSTIGERRVDVGGVDRRLPRA